MTDTTNTTAPASPEPSLLDLAANFDLAELFGEGLKTVGHLVGTAVNALIEHEKAQTLHIAQLEAGLKEKEGEILDLLAELDAARSLLQAITFPTPPETVTEANERLAPHVRLFLAKLDLGE